MNPVLVSQTLRELAVLGAQDSKGTVQVTLPEWVWSTFGQIDNVPEGTPGQLPDNYTLNCMGRAGASTAHAGERRLQLSGSRWRQSFAAVLQSAVAGADEPPSTSFAGQAITSRRSQAR